MSTVRVTGGAELHLQVVDMPAASVVIVTLIDEGGKPHPVTLTANQAQSLEMHVAAERFEAELRNRG